MPTHNLSGGSWEDFDAEALFPPPTIHANKLTKLDKKDLKKVDRSELGEDQAPFEEQQEPQDGDSYTDASPEKGHVDEAFQMDGLDSGSANERELKADKEEDRRTQPQEPSPKDGQKEGSEPKSDKSQDKSEKGKDSGAPEAEQAEGAEKPIQKEKEGVEEVAEATSKTSEDVHGGDEATKDIENSPNAANDGQNPDNQGAEAGEGGEGSKGAGQQPSDKDAGQSEGSDGEGTGQSANSQSSAIPAEDWEKKADQSALRQSFEDAIKRFEAKERDEKGHRTSMPSYQFDRKGSPLELEIAFKKARELIKKLAAEEDFTARVFGRVRWDAKALTRAVVSYRHPRIPSSRYERPKEADIVLLLDISGSCEAQAEMFMAIASGAVGDGVRVFVGYNGTARAIAMEPPKRQPRNYEQAKAWVQQEINRVSGWDNARRYGEWGFEQFVGEVKPKTLIIFGDWDGIDQYNRVVRNKSKFHSTKFFWFANEGQRSERIEEMGRAIPYGWTPKNYFPYIYRPQDLVRALRKIKN